MSTDITHPTQTPAVDNTGQANQSAIDAIPTTQTPAVDNTGQANQSAIDAIPTTQIPAVDNTGQANQSAMDAIPTTQIPAVDNKELVEELSTVTIPTTQIPAVDNKELVEELSTVTIPTTQIPAVDNQQLLRVWNTNIIPTTPTPVVDNKQQLIELGIDKIPTIKLPVVASRLKPRRRKSKGLQLLIIGVVTTVLFSVILSTYLLALENTSNHQTQSRRQQATPPVVTTPIVATASTATSTQDAQEVTAVGQQYMNALLKQQYNTMWSLLHPQVQAMWPNETSFTNYWQTRFQGFTLQQFTLGDVHSLSFWVNPETMTRYDQVEVLPISLQLSPQVSTDKLALLPTLDHNPSQLFQNLPLIAQRTTIRTGRETADQWLILSGGPADLEAPILPPITPVSRTIRMPILMYHHITDVPTHNVIDLSLTVTPKVFGQQLDYLKQHGYHTITFNQLFDFLYYNGPLPSKPIILTFDDGYDDAYTFAYPILKEHGYSGMFYIITGKVGWKGQATWDQLHKMLTNGMQMGSHTITHRNMGEVWRLSHAEAQQELQQSQHDLQTQLGLVIQQFCYPTGEPFHHEKPIVQQAIMALLEQDGYIGATTDPPPMGMTQDSQKPFILLRVRVDGRESLQEYSNSIP